MTTVLDTVVAALRKINVVAHDEPATGEQTDNGVLALGRLLRSWSNRKIAIFQTAGVEIVLTTAGSYALSPPPARIRSVRLRRSGTDTPLREMTRQEWDDISVKTSTGLPNGWYLDRQATAATLHVWPRLAIASGQTLQLTVERGFGEIGQHDVLPVLPEWEDAVVYNLADRLSDDYEVNNARVTDRASVLLEEALAADREGSVFFGDDCGYYDGWGSPCRG